MTTWAPAAGSTASGGKTGAQPQAHPHPAFVEAQFRYMRAADEKRDTEPIISALAGYVQLAATDPWFDEEWERLDRWARYHRIEGTGMGKRALREEWRKRQWALICKAAHRYHILETPQSPTTARHTEELRERLARFRARKPKNDSPPPAAAVASEDEAAE